MERRYLRLAQQESIYQVEDGTCQVKFTMITFTPKSGRIYGRIYLPVMVPIVFCVEATEKYNVTTTHI